MKKDSLKQLFANNDGQLSTTSTIQMIAVLSLCVGFGYSLLFDKAVTVELGLMLSVLGGATGFSKGYIDSKKSKDNKNE